MLEERMEAALRNVAEARFDEYVQVVSGWVAELLIRNPVKYEVTHENDPPWDCSGKLVQIGWLRLEDFQEKPLSELMSEYNGNKTASHVSGAGYFYLTYEEDLFKTTLDWVYGIAEQAVNCLKETEDQATVAGIQAHEADEDELNEFVTDPVYIVTDELRERIQLMNVDFLYRLGQDEAQRQILIERDKAERRRQEWERNQQVAGEVWRKIALRYKMFYGKNPPVKIEGDIYKTKLQPLLEIMRQEGLTTAEIGLVAEYLGHHFSQSVRAKLAGLE